MTTSGSVTDGGEVGDDGPQSSTRRSHRVTISDLAQRLHISKASVSYALNGRAGVSEETRQRVLDLAEELGFHPNSAAVALSASRTRTIGIVIARDPALISTEAFYMRTLVGIEQYLNEVDSSLLLRLTGEHGEDLDVLRRWSRQGRVDGFILFDELEDDQRIQLLKDLGLTRVRLLTNNPKKTDAFIYGGFDLQVVDQIPIMPPINKHNARYLATKRDKLGHHLPNVDS